MSLSSSRRKNKPRRDSIYREVSSDRFIAIRTIDEIEDIIDTSEAYMTNPTVIFNSDNTKVLFYYNTKNKNEIEEMETLFKNTVKPKSIITLSDAYYLDESSGDDTTYDISGTYRFEKYDATTKTIVAAPISVNKQSTTYSTYNSKYWLGSLLWTTSDTITTKTTSYEIVNFIGNSSNQSFSGTFDTIQPNDKIEIVGLGIFTVLNFTIDSDEGWERIRVKEKIPENDYIGELTHIRLLRSGIDNKKSTPRDKDEIVNSNITPSNSINRTPPPKPPLTSTDINILKNNASDIIDSANTEDLLRSLGMSQKGIDNIKSAQYSIQKKSKAYAENKRQEVEYKQTPKDTAKEAWLKSGSKTLNVTVVSTKNGNKFSINGNSPDNILKLNVGDTVLVKQSDKSNGLSGHTKDNHPLRFSIIKDGVHRGGVALPIDYVSNKQVGYSSSYYYITVPFVSKLFYYCENHQAMGQEIIMVRNDINVNGAGQNSGIMTRQGTNIGACCLNDICTETTSRNCDAFGGVFLGKNTQCVSDDNSNPCETYQIGACCGGPVNACCNDTDPEDCECDSEECKCTNTTKSVCLGLGINVEWNDAFKCDERPNGINMCCHQDDTIIGRCCYSSGCMGVPDNPICRMRTEFDCAKLNGKWSKDEKCEFACCDLIVPLP